MSAEREWLLARLAGAGWIVMCLASLWLTVTS